MVWPSINTGLAPAGHQAYFGTRLVEGTYTLRQRHQSDLRGTPVWRELAARGRNVAVVRDEVFRFFSERGGYPIAHTQSANWPAIALLLNETVIERAFNPPQGFDPELQGDWNSDLVTFKFNREIRLEKVERIPERLYVEYKFGELGYWAFEIEPDSVQIYRL